MTAGFFVAGTVIARSEATKQSIAPRAEKLDCFASLAMTVERATSQKALRIDIDLELEIALCLRPGRQPFAQIVRQVDIAQRLHQQAKTVAALDHRKRRFGGAEHLDPFIERRDRGEFSRKAFRGGT